MPSMKALKRRITSVNNTQQIMKAMNLVAASKVQKSKNKMEAVRPMFNAAKEFMTHGISHPDAEESVYFKASENKNAVYAVLSGERGLCGSYNANILKAALAQMDADKEAESRVIAVGATCKDYFVRRKKNVVANYAGVLENVSFSAAVNIAEKLTSLYVSADRFSRADKIYIAYTQFETLLSHTPRVVRLLPIDFSSPAVPKEVIYEPDVHTYLKKSVPVYLTMFIYGAMLESSVCEQAARMTSMDSASRNAEEIADSLTLQYNRQRQGAITQEISEIVGGANAV